MGDYKLIVGNPGSHNDWYPVPPLEGSQNVEMVENDISLNEKIQLYNIKRNTTLIFI